MLECFVRIAAAVTAAFAICSFELPALADGTADVYQRSLVPGANDAIKSVMMRPAATPQPTPAAALGDGSVAQSPPGSLHRGPKMELPGGRFEYRFDVNTAYPYGNIGSYGKGWLMGGIDASVGYGFNWSTRLIASMFQLQHWPYGFNSGTHAGLSGRFPKPRRLCRPRRTAIAAAPAPAATSTCARRTRSASSCFRRCSSSGPTSCRARCRSSSRRRTSCAAARSASLRTTTTSCRSPITCPTVRSSTFPLRTAQYYAVGITLPFLKTPKMFGTFTMAPQWLVHTAGANVGNSMQVRQVVYLEYTPLRGTTLFFEPQSSRDYLPTDPYPEHSSRTFWASRSSSPSTRSCSRSQ